MGRGLADATHAIAEAVQNVRHGAGCGDVLIGPRRVGDEMLVDGLSGEAGVGERG